MKKIILIMTIFLMSGICYGVDYDAQVETTQYDLTFYKVITDDVPVIKVRNADILSFDFTPPVERKKFEQQIDPVIRVRTGEPKTVIIVNEDVNYEGEGASFFSGNVLLDIGKYEIALRIVDMDGAKSKYSDPILIEILPIAPGRPASISVKIITY